MCACETASPAAVSATRHMCVLFSLLTVVTRSNDTVCVVFYCVVRWFWQAFKKAAKHKPCVLVFRHLHALGVAGSDAQDDDNQVVGEILNNFLAPELNAQDNHANNQKGGSGVPRPILVVGTTHKPLSELPGQLRGCFVHTIEFEAPSEAERLQLIQSIFSSIPCAEDVSFDAVAKETASCTARDLTVLARQTMRVAAQRQVGAAAEKSKSKLNSASVSPGNNAAVDSDKSKIIVAAGSEPDSNTVGMEDVRAALAILQVRKAGKIGAPKIPSVKWADVGGLGAAKTEILDTIQLPLQHPELLAQGLQRSGVLLYGPPGTGKTLLAKAVATECNLNFFSVKGPELINPYVGQSEANIRNVFAKARAARPCVIFFDELDSLAPNRGKTGDSGGVMDRIVSQLLAELDGMCMHVLLLCSFPFCTAVHAHLEQCLMFRQHIHFFHSRGSVPLPGMTSSNDVFIIAVCLCLLHCLPPCTASPATSLCHIQPLRDEDRVMFKMICWPEGSYFSGKSVVLCVCGGGGWGV